MSVINFTKNTLPFLSIATGMDDEVKPVHVFGFVDGIGSSDVPSSIYNGGGLYPFVSSASQLSLVSTASDTMSATVKGLDSNYDEIEETVTLTGTTAVSTTQSFLRVHSLSTSDTNAGVITASIGSDVLGKIEVGSANSLMAVYTVPRGCTAYLTGLDVSVNKGHDAQVSMFTGNGSFSQVQFTSDVYESAYSYRPCNPIKLPQMTDIDFRVVFVENSNTRVACGFEMVVDKCLNY